MVKSSNGQDLSEINSQIALFSFDNRDSTMQGAYRVIECPIHDLRPGPGNGGTNVAFPPPPPPPFPNRLPPVAVLVVLPAAAAISTTRIVPPNNGAAAVPTSKSSTGPAPQPRTVAMAISRCNQGLDWVRREAERSN